MYVRTTYIGSAWATSLVRVDRPEDRCNITIVKLTCYLHITTQATPEVSFLMLVTIASIVVVAMIIVIAFDRAILHHLSVKPNQALEDNKDAADKTK